MLPSRQKAELERENQENRCLRCTKCGVLMCDGEPWSPEGEFFHRRNGCSNQDLWFRFNPIKGNRSVHGIERVSTKKYGRARRRGAKLASKHRPK
jgi:hypothetical protein